MRCEPGDHGEFRVDAPLPGPVYVGEVGYLVGQSESFRTTFHMPPLVDADNNVLRDILRQRIAAYTELCADYSAKLEAKWVPAVERMLGSTSEDLITDARYHAYTQIAVDSIEGQDALVKRVNALNASLADLDGRVIDTIRVKRYLPVWHVDARDREANLKFPGWLVEKLPELADKKAEVEKLAVEKTHSPDNIRRGLERLISVMARNLDEKRAEKAREDDEAATIADWVKKHGTTDQKARAAEGLLPQQDVLDAMRNALFEPLAQFERFKRLQGTDFCRCDWIDEDNIEYESGEAESASKREYEGYRAIREIARNIQKDAGVELRYHRGECDGCDKSKTRKSVRVTLHHGPFVFSREYACPQPEKN